MVLGKDKASTHIYSLRSSKTSKDIGKVRELQDFYHSPLSTLVCIENTTNKGGGAFYDLKELEKIRLVCDEHNFPKI